MKSILFTAVVFLSLLGTANAQKEDATLVFKRPFANFIGDGFYDTKISVNGKEACVINSSTSKIELCTQKVNAGEVKVIVSTTRGTDYENIFDVVQGKTYTLVVYMRNFQMIDMLWEEISSNIIANKAKDKESSDFNAFSYKALVISIK
jgi:hypothetical protein